MGYPFVILLENGPEVQATLKKKSTTEQQDFAKNGDIKIHSSTKK